jgi:hypothetical protein
MYELHLLNDSRLARFSPAHSQKQGSLSSNSTAFSSKSQRRALHTILMRYQMVQNMRMVSLFIP